MAILRAGFAKIQLCLGAFSIFWPVESSGKPLCAKCWFLPSEFTESYRGLASCALR